MFSYMYIICTVYMYYMYYMSNGFSDVFFYLYIFSMVFHGFPLPNMDGSSESWSFAAVCPRPAPEELLDG